MQVQTMKRYLGNQMVTIGLAAGIVLAGVGAIVISDVDILPSRGSDPVAVEQPKPVFHRPADRIGVGIGVDIGF